jgi:undecaprenyl-diphosphatase
LPLGVAASLSFIQLASELRDEDLTGFDDVTAGLVHQARGSFDQPMLWLTRLGDARSLVLLTAFALLVLLGTRRWRHGVFLLAATCGTALLSWLLKLVFRRGRPSEVLYLLTLPSSFSFPSGHALGSTGVLASLLMVVRALGLRGPLWWALLVVVCLLVGGIALSRVYFGVHFPSDVLGGVFAGVAWVAALTGWFYPRLLPGERTTKPPPLQKALDET